MSNENLRVGSIVFLSEDHDWQRDHSNPLTLAGSIHEVSNGVLTVVWDNEEANTYNQEDSDLISMIQPTREAARIAAKLNRNLTVDKIGDFWVLKLKRNLVIGDGSPAP